VLAEASSAGPILEQQEEGTESGPSKRVHAWVLLLPGRREVSDEMASAEDFFVYKL
jgi:hypothetical protein